MELKPMSHDSTTPEKANELITEKLPASWRCTTYRTTGNRKRVAVFEHQDTSQRVTIRPWKTYEQPGFPNAHRVLSFHDDEREVLAVGHEIESIPAAETVAVTAMQQRTGAD